MADINDALETLRQHLNQIGETSVVYDRIKNAISEIETLIARFPVGQINQTREAFERLLSAISNVSNSISSINSNGIDSVVDSVNNLESALNNCNSASETTSTNIGNISSQLTNAATNANSFSDAMDSAASNASNISQSLGSTQSSSKNVATSTAKMSNSMSGGAQSVNKIVEGWSWVKVALQEIEKLAKGTWKNWKNIDDIASKHGRTLGLDKDDIQGYRKSLLGMYKDLAVQYGMNNKELYAIQEGYARATGKARLLTKQVTGDLASNTKIIGQENVNAIAEAMDNLGGSAMGAAGAMANISQRARAQGLDAVKAAKGMAEAMKMSQKYTFREGVNGMSKMVAKAQSLKVSMQSIESAAEKFSTIEGAITTSAQLQVLGGQLQNAFSNPMEMMGLALTDMGEFQDRLLKGFQSVSYFNEQTGRMDMSQLDKMRLQAAAKAAGMSYEDAFNAATQKGLRDRIDRSLNAGANSSKLSEEGKEWVRNTAQFNNEKKRFEIEWFDESNKRHTSDVEHLTDEAINAIKKRGTKEDAMADDVNVIRNILDKNKDYAMSTKSWNETMEGAETSVFNGLGRLIDGLVPKSLLLSLSKLGIAGAAAIYGLKTITSIVGGLYSNVARPAFMKGGLGGIKQALFGKTQMFTKNGKEIITRKGMKGTWIDHGPNAKVRYTPYTGKNPNVVRQRGIFGNWFKSPTSVASNAAQTSTAQVASNVAPNVANGAASSGGRFARGAKSALNVLKKNKKTAAFAALIAGGVYLSSKFSGSGNAESKAASESVESDGTILGELQKQTSLLEKLAGGTTSSINGGGASETSSLYERQEQSEGGVGIGVGDVAKFGLGFARAAQPWMWASLGADATNAIGQMLGGWEEGGAVDKSLTIGSRASEYAGYGGVIGGALGAIFPVLGNIIGGGVGAAIGGAVGAVKGTMEAFSSEMGEKSKKMLEQGGFWNTIGGGVLKAGAWLGGYEDPEKLAQQQNAANGSLDQMLFERTKMGVTSIADPQIMQKGALATIQIHDLLVSRWNKEDDIDFSADKIKGWRKDIAEGDMTAEDIMKKFGAKNEVGHMATGGIVGASEKPLPGETVDTALAKLAPGEMVINQAQQGKLWSWINKGSEIVSKPVVGTASIIKKGLSGGLDLLKNGVGENAGTQNISVNINGTIKLVGDGNVGKIDARELAKNKEFMDMIYRHVTSQMDRKGQLGIGTNKNSSLATRGYGIESGVAT